MEKVNEGKERKDTEDRDHDDINYSNEKENDYDYDSDGEIETVSSTGSWALNYKLPARYVYGRKDEDTWGILKCTGSSEMDTLIESNESEFLLDQDRHYFGRMRNKPETHLIPQPFISGIHFIISREESRGNETTAAA